MATIRCWYGFWKMMSMAAFAGFGPAGEGYVRMALVENENRLRQAVRQIGRCLKKKERD